MALMSARSTIGSTSSPLIEALRVADCRRSVLNESQARRALAPLKIDSGRPTGGSLSPTTARNRPTLVSSLPMSANRLRIAATSTSRRSLGSSGTDRTAEDAYAAAVADAHASREQAVAARAAAALARQVADGDRAAIGGVNPLAAEFVNMTRSLLQSETVELAMQDVVHAAVRFVNGCDAASFSAYADNVVTTLASTGPIADEADAEQYRAFDGPCLQAIQTMQLVIAADLTSDQRWPKFVRAATNVRSVISAPVSNERPTGAEPGSLNNYSMQANAFTSEDADTAILLTAHLGVLLRLAVMTFEANTLVNQLTEAVTTRDVIGQAKGILMERERLTAGQAFDVLRAASQRLNRKLRDVADQLATSGEIATDPPGRDR